MAFTCSKHEHADKIFNLRGPVRSDKWQSNERPLDPKPQPHHRLVKGSDSTGNYYDVKLYHTIMARFYEPKVEDGKRIERKLYMGHSSQTSRKFMWEVLNVSVNANTGQYRFGLPHETPRDEIIVVPVYTKAFMHTEDGTPFSLDAVLVDGVLDVSRSAHTPHHRLVADNNVRQHKRNVVAKFDPYITLALMRMEEFKDSCKLDSNYGYAFGGEGFNREYFIALREMWNEDMPHQNAIDDFFRMCQKAYDVIASKRGYAQKGFNMPYRWRTANGSDSTVDELDNPITTDDLKRAIIDRIHKYVGSNDHKKPQEVPQFARLKDYPMSNIHV